ncbi:MAG: septum formation family protein [Chloroflexota bacterium]
MNRTFLGALLVALAVAASACSGGDASDSPRSSGAASVVVSPTVEASESLAASEPASSPAEGEATAANDLSPSDCFNTDGSQVDEVSVVDCEQPHFYEAFLNYDMTQGDAEAYPGDEAVLSDADDQCRPAFEEYVGTAYDDSALYITVIRPSESTWGDGDRTVICVVNTENAATEMTGSAEGTEQ